MSKLLSVLVAAVFATVSLSSIAASHSGAPKDDKAMADKMAACKKMDEKKADDKMKAECKKMMEEKKPAAEPAKK